MYFTMLWPKFALRACSGIELRNELKFRHSIRLLMRIVIQCEWHCVCGLSSGQFLQIVGGTRGRYTLTIVSDPERRSGCNSSRPFLQRHSCGYRKSAHVLRGKRRVMRSVCCSEVPYSTSNLSERIDLIPFGKYLSLSIYCVPCCV